jgi:RIO kinase 1
MHHFQALIDNDFVYGLDDNVGFDENSDFDAFGALDRRAHRELVVRQRGRPTPRGAMPVEVVEQIDTGDDAFIPGHACSDNEQALLRDTLGVFYRDNVITDVLARVKGGKEANVYCCQAHPSTGLDLVAAKIYRPRAHRTMRNDAIYREGRLMLDEEGKGIVRGARFKRALAKKTEFGREVMTFTWIEHEYDLMQLLFAEGADVPRPIGHVGSAILMEYFGELNRPAPTLNGVRLATRREAEAMLERLLWHVELMLRHDRVHGDLSAFNVLCWAGRGVVIDFPQAVVASTNPHAEWLLARDVERLCQYFGRYGIEVDGAAVAGNLWGRFVNARL